MWNDWLVDWPGAVDAGPLVCGGKGWNLGCLHRYGFPVPVGGVLIADAYLRFMAAPPLPEMQAAFTTLSPGDVLNPEMARKLEVFRTAIQAAPLPPDVADALRAFLADTGLAGVPVAVRSSATGEDGATASFAGMHQSFLNVTGTEAVQEAVKGCYASLWTPQALAYRRRLGLDDASVACAVVLCAMIGGPAGAPRAAGVAFSCDPRSGRRNETILSAVPGLGEALVAGRVNPEEIVVAPVRGTLRIVRRMGRAERVLTDRQAVELARLTLRVAWALGDGQEPQDVEWAHDGRRFWLLQARPVTRLPRVTFAGVARLPVIWSNTNLREVIPGVASTLTWSMLQTILRDITYASLEAAGYRLPEGMETVRCFSGRLYFDLSALQWGFYDCFGLPPAETNRSVGGHQPEIPLPPGNPFHGRRGGARLKANLKLFRLFFRVGRTHHREMAKLRAFAQRLKAVDFSRQTAAALLELWHRIRDHGAFSHQFQLANAVAGGWQAILRNVLTWRSPERGPALTAALMAGSGGVTTAEHGYRLYDLAETARRDPAARDYLAREPRDPHGWRQLPKDSPFRVALEGFLAEFGHRATYETELANPRWNEDPTYLLDQARFLLAAGPTASPREKARSRRTAAEAEVARLTFFLRPLVRWLADRARRASALREASRSSLVALWEPTRYLILDIGRRLAAIGALEAPADAFHLSWLDLEAFLLGEWNGAGCRALVADRKARAERWQTEDPPHVLILDMEGRPAELPASAPGPSPTPGPHLLDSRTLTGVGVAAGRASGPARILRHPTEGPRLQPGDVLVAPSTDPAWTPLFLRASALVMEVGGYLSHGAIVAREYGIPAVVNVPGLLQAVRDGQRLLVDGDAGRIEMEGEE